MAFNRFLTISPIALVVLSACKQNPAAGGGVTGNIVKGPLSNALVFLDLDGDNVLDANEQSVRTDADGKFTINSTASNYKIVALTDDSTVDTSSGAVLSGVTLSAPQGASVVTPTTTLMEEGGLTKEEVAEVLGLPDGVDPLSFNPFAAGVDAAQALAVEKVSQQIMTAVSSFASAAEGAGASEKGAFTAALNSVVDVVKVKAEKIDDPNAAAADKKIDFTKAADLDLIKAKVADEAEKIVTAEGTTGFSKAALTSLVNDTATSIKNVNDQIGAVSDLTSDASKNVFSTLQVLQDQVKNAAIAEKATPGSGSIDFKDAAKVTASAKNKAPTEIKLSIDTITEGSSNLLIGNLQTVDSDQKTGEKFKYEIVEIAGTDFKNFSMNKDTGAFSFKETPVAGSYKVIIKSTDAGGKSFAKEVKINVQKDFHKDVLAKVDVQIKDYTKLDAYFTELDDLEKEVATAIKASTTELVAFESEMMPTGTSTPPTPTISINKDASGNPTTDGFTISFGGNYSAVISTTTGTITSQMASAAKDKPLVLMGTEGDPGIGMSDSWTSSKVSKIVVKKGSTEVIEASATSTALEITYKSASSGEVDRVKLTGDFSKFDYSNVMEILMELNPSHSGPEGSHSGSESMSSSSSSSSGSSSSGSSSSSSSGSGSYGSYSGSESMSSSSSSSSGSSSSGSSSSSSSGSGSHEGSSPGGLQNYNITKAEIFKKGTETAVATSSISTDKVMELSMGDYKVKATISGTDFTPDGSAIFELAGIDLLDLEAVVMDKISGTMTLSKGNTELLKAVSDMSALKDAKLALGPEEVFGVYDGKMFMADSNYQAAAYFDFNEVAIDAAAFEKIWSNFGDDETLPEIT